MSNLTIWWLKKGLIRILFLLVCSQKYRLQWLILFKKNVRTQVVDETVWNIFGLLVPLAPHQNLPDCLSGAKMFWRLSTSISRFVIILAGTWKDNFLLPSIGQPTLRQFLSSKYWENYSPSIVCGACIENLVNSSNLKGRNTTHLFSRTYATQQFEAGHAAFSLIFFVVGTVIYVHEILISSFALVEVSNNSVIYIMV